MKMIYLNNLTIKIVKLMKIQKKMKVPIKFKIHYNSTNLITPIKTKISLMTSGINFNSTQNLNRYINRIKNNNNNLSIIQILHNNPKFQIKLNIHLIPLQKTITNNLPIQIHLLNHH
jgi:hypothetical protein